MNIFEHCELLAIDHFKTKNIDISTREKRIALSAERKKEIFNFLANVYLDEIFII